MSAPAPRCHLLRLLIVLTTAVPAVQVGAQEERQYVPDLGDGLRTPLTALAGEFDALAVVANPAGLGMLRGSHLGVLISLDDPDRVRDAGSGFGMYYGALFGGGLLPRVGFGAALEFLRPERSALVPDPGTPRRLSLAASFGAGEHVAVGVAWRRFFDDSSLPLDDVTTFDLGLTARLGPHFAVGAIGRDLGRPSAGDSVLRRRYELELAVRPAGTERFELGLGGRAGEDRDRVDGWLRWSWRMTPGAYLKGQFLAQNLRTVATTPGGSITGDVYEGRVTAGLEVVVGGYSSTWFGTLASDLDGASAAVQSGSWYIGVTSEPRASIIGDPPRIAQLELTGAVSEQRLTGLVASLKRIRQDAAVVALFVRIDGLGAGWAATRTLRTELGKLQAAGKKVFAYLAAGTTRDYYLASVADRVWVDPAGGLWLAGFAATTLYFRDLLGKLGVFAQFEKIEEFKSAPEAFTRAAPSEAAVRMRDALFDDIYATIVTDIARSRGIPPDQVRTLFDAGPYTAGQLQAVSSLVDAVVQPDDLDGLVQKELGRAYPVGNAPYRRPEAWQYPSIAVIYLEGDIVTGKSRTIPILGRKMAGAESIASAIASARTRVDIQAIVLRINSPGGSALASEMIAREVFKTRGVKPIICALGDVAASGGYFAAAGCDVIYAEPTTITGSIGIYTGKFDISGLLSRLGVTWAIYKRGHHSDRESYLRAYTAEEQTRVKEQIGYYYGRFLSAVARGRGMTERQVDEVGRGRVWTGRQAVDAKLVDELGGMGDAIARAKRDAGISDGELANLVELPESSPGLLGRLLGIDLNAAEPQAAAVLGAVLGELREAVPGSMLVDPSAPQARLPFFIRWD
jgi:protease IV